MLIFLAISSGITKIMLMPQDVEFFGKYGFTNPILIAFGAVQVIGGAFMVFSKIRAIGAAIVAITFLISTVVLFMSGNTPVALVTLICVLLLMLVIKKPNYFRSD